MHSNRERLFAALILSGGFTGTAFAQGAPATPGAFVLTANDDSWVVIRTADHPDPIVNRLLVKGKTLAVRPSPTGTLVVGNAGAVSMTDGARSVTLGATQEVRRVSLSSDSLASLFSETAKSETSGAPREKAEPAAPAKLDSETRLEAARVAKEEAERIAAAAVKEQKERDTAALAAYAESAAPEDAGAVNAVVGSGTFLSWPEASRRIAIADEGIASFNVISPREVVINGLKPGRTTVFVWLTTGRRLFYRLLVEHNLEPARAALRNADPSLILESGADGDSVILRGRVENESVARQRRGLVEQLLPRKTADGKEGLRLVSLLEYGGVIGTPEDRLAAALSDVDTRIRVRRMQTGPEPNTEKDSYVLEGRVKDINALVQAVILAERQLGGKGAAVKAADDGRVTFQRSSGAGLSGIGTGGQGGGLQALQQGEPPKSGLSAQIARGLLVMSESGRVVSFLKVDSLPQILVAIRVLEVDRTKARRLGIDFRADRKNFSASTSTIPGGPALPDLRGKASALAGAGNVLASYVDKTISAVAALDFMTEKEVARSVAEPNILTLSGEQASVLVGGEVPIPTTTINQVSSQSGFFFQQFGVRLDIRPTVDASGLVTLEVAPSIVNPSGALGNSQVPGFTIQRVETTARVQAGESLILGGLLSSSESVTDRGIPILGKIPGLGWKKKSVENTELLFLITPQIVDGPSGPVRLPSLDFPKTAGPNLGTESGLGPDGVPTSFAPVRTKVASGASSCLELRQRPDAGAELLDCLVPGTEVFVLEPRAEWRRVHLEAGGEGWVRASGLEVKAQKP